MGSPLVIDRLYQGSSGQAPWQRKIGTVESSRNVRFDIRVGGGIKRNATELLADLDAFTGETFDDTLEYAWTAIRGSTIAISAAGVVHGWDENGLPLDTIDLTSGGFATYMALVVDLVKDIDVTLSFDTAIICNRNIIPLLVPAWDHQQSINMVANADIADDTDVVGLATIGLDGEVNGFSDLPTGTSRNTGEVWRVTSNEQFNPLGFYLHYDPLESGIPDVHPESAIRRHAEEWFRIPEADQREGAFDPDTMPFRLIYDEALGTITIKRSPWLPRLSGNETTNPPLQWASLGQAIRSVEFHSGRLMILGKAHVTSSRKDDFFNLWNFDISAVNNQDRIAANITQSELGNALRCKSGGGGLFITLENGQVEFSSGSAELTNGNGRTVTVMDLASVDIKPSAAGNSLTMVDELGDVHQFNWQVGDRESNIIYSGLLSAHQWDVLDGKTVKRIFSIGTTVFITIDAGPAVVHDSFFIGGNAEQSAWGDFDPVDPPVHFQKWKDKIKIVTRRDTTSGGYSLLDYVHREQEPPEGSGLLYMPALDRMELVDNTVLTYDDITDRTTAIHTGRDGVLTGLGRSFIVTTEPDKHAFIPAIAIDANGNPQFDGDLTGDTLNFEQFLGFNYRTEMVLTDLYPGLTGQNLVMQRLVVFHLESSDYEVIYTDAGGVVRTSQWQAHRVGVAKTDEPSLDTGFSDHGVRGDPRTMPITLRSDTPGTVAWLGLEYELIGQGRGKP